MHTRRVLITGGCGFIGSNLIRYLRESDDLELRVLDNESIGSFENIAAFDIECIRGELNDEVVVRRALNDVDLVVHLAADTGVLDSVASPERNFRVNVTGTLNLLGRMREQGVVKIVNASTGGAILGDATPPIHEDMPARPLSPYGASKLAAEAYCSAFSTYGLAATSLRFSNVYGPGSQRKGSVVAHFMKQILSGKELVIYGDGSQTRDYVFVSDLCEGIRLAMTSGRTGVFQLGTGVPTTLNALVAQLREVVGGAYPVTVRYEPSRPGEVVHTWCDIDKARRELGYDPRTSLAAGLSATWRWFRRSMT
jgi:UDP-glucose 4-epimerase